MLDVGTQPETGVELVRKGGPLVGRTGGHRRQVRVPRDSGGPQVCQRHSVRAQDADIAAGQRHILQLRQALKALVVGQHHLAAPDRAVAAVTRSVEGEPKHLR